MTTSSAIRQLELQSATRQRAAADLRIRGAGLAVYLFLSDTLDDERFVKVPVPSLARSLTLHVVTTAQALQRLVSRGYLERGQRMDRVWSYRLKWETPEEKAG